MKSTMTYAAEFMSLTSILGLNKKSKLMNFHNGLSLTLKHALAISGKPATFPEYMVKAIKID